MQLRCHENRKPVWSSTPRVFDHTGLPFNGPPSMAGLSFVQSPDRFFYQINLVFTECRLTCALYASQAGMQKDFGTVRSC